MFFEKKDKPLVTVTRLSRDIIFSSSAGTLAITVGMDAGASLLIRLLCMHLTAPALPFRVSRVKSRFLQRVSVSRF